MPKVSISPEEIRAYRVLQEADAADAWLTSEQLAGRARIAGRTARAYLLAWSEIELVSALDVYPARLYRLKDGATRQPENAALHVAKIESAASALRL